MRRDCSVWRVLKRILSVCMNTTWKGRKKREPDSVVPSEGTREKWTEMKTD